LSRLVGIHQPYFLPWLGYFDKLASVDTFVMLDDVQFPKKQGTFMNRASVLVGGAPHWITMPVVRSYHGLRQVREMRIDDSGPWRDKVLRTIAQGYARASALEETLSVIERVIRIPTDNLAEFNQEGIRLLAAHLGVGTKHVVLSSTLGVNATSTERLVHLTKAVGGTAYLTGKGEDTYRDDGCFAAAGLRLRRHAFHPSPYPQATSKFVPWLSVIDALMSCGAAGTQQLITFPDHVP
jgi:hypothetical protein